MEENEGLEVRERRVGKMLKRILGDEEGGESGARDNEEEIW